MARKPKYAVVVLGENADVGGFFNLLISNGYSNVTFLNSLSEHTEVKKLLKDMPMGKTKGRTGDGCESPAQATVTVKTKGRLSLPGDHHHGSRLDSKSEMRPNPMYRATRLVQGEDSYISCKLCDNRIMCTRLSNLTNHVRRHAAAKQFQCVHCTYQHNEPAKVRYHMAHQHNDSLSQPRDNLTPEMQQIWAEYMEKCFPDYDEQLRIYQSREEAVRAAAAVTGSGLEMDLPPMVPSRVDRLIHRCIICGVVVPMGDVPVTHERSNLVRHIAERHAECVPYECGECAYRNAEQWKVRLHISTRHPMIAADVEVVQGPTGLARLFLAKFFPSTEDIDGVIDAEEEYLLAELHKASSAAHEHGIDMVAGWSQNGLSSSGNSLIVSGSNSVDNKLIPLSIGVESEEKQIESENKFYSPDEKETTCCTVCGMVLDFQLMQLMSHSKRHYHIKQFECSKCVFSSNDIDAVKGHIEVKHGLDAVIKDHNNPTMQKAWMRVMVKCFPNIIEKLTVVNSIAAGSQNKKEKQEEKIEEKMEAEPGETNAIELLSQSGMNLPAEDDEVKTDSVTPGSQPITEPEVEAEPESQPVHIVEPIRVDLENDVETQSTGMTTRRKRARLSGV